MEHSKSWYGKVFGAPVVFEDSDAAASGFDNAMVNLLRRPAASELIAPANVARGRSGSNFQLTIWVDDADLVCTTLHERGVVLLNG